MKESYSKVAIEAITDKSQRAAIGQSMNDLVSIQHREAVTTSLKVAAFFAKRHDDVLKAIRNLNSSEQFSLRNFAESTYVDERGKVQPMFEIKRDGCIRLTMGFSGKQASECVEKYIDAFNLMEKTLLQQHNLSWQQQRLEGKVIRRELTDAVRDFVEYATSQGSKQARLYYQNITLLTYKALFFVKEASPKNFRDMLDTMHNTFLATAEYIARQSLVDGMTQQLPYKEVYILVKQRVTTYAATLPHQHLICK
jgi:Rha family phage regulatory protein